jgi:hypothetical protein
MEGKLPHDAKRIATWLPNRGRPWKVVPSPAIGNQQNFFTASGGQGEILAEKPGITSGEMGKT